MAGDTDVADSQVNTDVVDVHKEISRLRKMAVKELRRRHVELFAEENRSGNRQYLFRRIAWRLQVLAEGGLSERARRRVRELACDADLRIRPPMGLMMAPAPVGLNAVTGSHHLATRSRTPTRRFLFARRCLWHISVVVRPRITGPRSSYDLSRQRKGVRSGELRGPCQDVTGLF